MEHVTGDEGIPLPQQSGVNGVGVLTVDYTASVFIIAVSITERDIACLDELLDTTDGGFAGAVCQGSQLVVGFVADAQSVGEGKEHAAQMAGRVGQTGVLDQCVWDLESGLFHSGFFHSFRINKKGGTRFHLFCDRKLFDFKGW